ncbi:MAG TPA: ABC-F family ATP-binding cassette domain-containing protein, partial [bacterium]|nr:ABC-F family ATP-binding cassette domain-containing protein [bacterium]
MSLTVKGLTKSYGPRTLFQDVSFGLGKGERVALIGPNGAGKTTLLKILAGLEEADSGSVEKPRTGFALGYLAQVQHDPGARTVFEEAMRASPRILELRHEKQRLEAAMGEAHGEDEVHRLADQYHQLLTQYESVDGYAYEGRVSRILKGMGFAEERWNRPVASLSGGERSQLELCKLLVEEPPLLLLDEPTNHLDLEAVEWLEGFLKTYGGAILVVTHDRYFLDAVCTRIVELAFGQVDSYAGGYERYLEQKAERVVLQQRAYEKQQDEIEKLTRFINRWRADAKRHKQARGREKKLSKMERIGAPTQHSRDLALMFQQAQPSWTRVLEVEGLTKRYGERTLFQNVTFSLDRGERMAIVGRNGAGKTTLLRLLMDREPYDAGRIEWGGQTEVGYFSQARVEFPEGATVFSAVAEAHRHLTRQQVAALLGAVGFNASEWERPIAQCSGGEQSRAALAILLASRSNVLLLDEPTNHLDILAREALEEALEVYPGTVIFISHDRRFIDRLADKLLVIQGSRTRTVLGNYAHWQWVQQQEAAPAPMSNGDGRAKVAKPKPASTPKASKPKWTLEMIVEEVDRLERQIADYHAQLADPALHRDYKQAQAVQESLATT